MYDITTDNTTKDNITLIA